MSAGVRVEAIKALADGCEDDLNDEERQQVEFIRAVRDGTMTDEIWERMIERLGSVRGAIEFAFFVCYLWLHHRMNWAFSGWQQSTNKSGVNACRSIRMGLGTQRMRLAPTCSSHSNEQVARLLPTHHKDRFQLCDH